MARQEESLKRKRERMDSFICFGMKVLFRSCEYCNEHGPKPLPSYRAEYAERPMLANGRWDLIRCLKC